MIVFSIYKRNLEARTFVQVGENGRITATKYRNIYPKKAVKPMTQISTPRQRSMTQTWELNMDTCTIKSDVATIGTSEIISNINDK